LALDGFLQFGIMYIAYTASFNYLKAYEVALFTIFTPIYVTLIDDAFNREFNPNFLMSALMAVAGTYIIEVGQAVNSGIWWGFLLVQISNLGFAFGQVFYRRLMADEAGLKDRDVFGALYLGAFVGTGIVTLIFTPLASLHLSLTHLVDIDLTWAFRHRGFVSSSGIWEHARSMPARLPFQRPQDPAFDLSFNTGVWRKGKPDHPADRRWDHCLIPGAERNLGQA